MTTKTLVDGPDRPDLSSFTAVARNCLQVVVVGIETIESARGNPRAEITEICNVLRRLTSLAEAEDRRLVQLAVADALADLLEAPDDDDPALEFERYRDRRDGE